MDTPHRRHQEQCCAKSWPFGGIRCYQFDTKHIGNDLSPEWTFCPTAGRTHLLKLQSLPTENGETVFETKGHALQDRTDQVTSVMTGSETDPTTTRIGIQVWGALPLQIG